MRDIVRKGEPELFPRRIAVDMSGNTELQEVHKSRKISRARKLALGLGCFSIGLGLAETLAPRKMARVTGVSRRNSELIRFYGLREMASGFAIFSQRRRPARAVWSRVVGDALDLASLGIAFASPRTKKVRLGIATANVAAVTALDVFCARTLSRGYRGGTMEKSFQMA